MPGSYDAMDINADLGEGIGDDDAILDVVTSANIACGGHAGDRETMKRTCEAARERKVTIGAHPSYADRENFGRRAVEIAEDALAEQLREQCHTLIDIATELGTSVRYIKPHGALYHAVAAGDGAAQAMITVAEELQLPLLMPAGSALASRGKTRAPDGTGDGARRRSGVAVYAEGFADRGYTTSGSLVPRGRPGAVLEDLDAIANRVQALAAGAAITASDGALIKLDVDTICVHSDTPSAVQIAARVRSELDNLGVPIRAFA